MALALGEDRHQHVGAGHLLPAGRLHMDHRALDHALESGGGLGILAAVGDQIVKLVVEILDEIAAQLVEIDIAGAHHRGRVLVVDQREQQMFKGRVFVVALVGDGEGAVEGLFETARKVGNGPHRVRIRCVQACSSRPTHFFSMTHCSGC